MGLLCRRPLPGGNQVTFQSESETVVGNLDLPAYYSPGDKLLTIIVTGTWITTKEKMPGIYATPFLPALNLRVSKIVINPRKNSIAL